MQLHSMGRLLVDGSFEPVEVEVAENTARRMRDGHGAYVGTYGMTRRPDMHAGRVYESLAVTRDNRDGLLWKLGAFVWDDWKPASQASARSDR